MLTLVGLTPPSTFLFRFPHELSGGQRQRVAIARALVVNPIFVVADEPTSMLDVSIRTGVMNLMLELGSRLNVSYLYITHDLAVARYMGRNLAVMYLGKIVEMGNTEEVLAHGLHPYTLALLSAVPVPDPQLKRPAAKIKGGVTAPIDPPARCRFYDRCPISDDYCFDPRPSAPGGQGRRPLRRVLQSLICFSFRGNHPKNNLLSSATVHPSPMIYLPPDSENPILDR